jgi:hypothetical protein
VTPSTLVVVQRRYPTVFCRRAEVEGGRPTYLTRRAMARDEGAAERRAAKVGGGSSWLCFHKPIGQACSTVCVNNEVRGGLAVNLRMSALIP